MRSSSSFPRRWRRCGSSISRGSNSISRKTLWRDLHEARRKVADALVHGKTIRIVGCGRRGEEGCPDDEGGPSP